MLRSLTAPCALTLALFAFGDTAQAQPGRFAPGGVGIGIETDRHDHGLAEPRPGRGIGLGNGRLRIDVGRCGPGFCPPPPRCTYLVQCRPVYCWKFVRFHCYQEAYRFACCKRDQGFEVCLVKDCHYYKVKFRKIACWNTYRKVYDYQEAVYLRRGLINRGGHDVRIVRR